MQRCTHSAGNKEKPHLARPTGGGGVRKILLLRRRWRNGARAEDAAKDTSVELVRLVANALSLINLWMRNHSFPISFVMLHVQRMNAYAQVVNVSKVVTLPQSRARSYIMERVGPKSCISKKLILQCIRYLSLIQ